jgi:hypothetical protein
MLIGRSLIESRFLGSARSWIAVNSSSDIAAAYDSRSDHFAFSDSTGDYLRTKDDGSGGLVRVTARGNEMFTQIM